MVRAAWSLLIWYMILRCLCLFLCSVMHTHFVGILLHHDEHNRLWRCSEPWLYWWIYNFGGCLYFYFIWVLWNLIEYNFVNVFFRSSKKAWGLLPGNSKCSQEVPVLQGACYIERLPLQVDLNPLESPWLPSVLLMHLCCSVKAISFAVQLRQFLLWASNLALPSSPFVQLSWFGFLFRLTLNLMLELILE